MRVHDFTALFHAFRSPPSAFRPWKKNDQGIFLQTYKNKT
jgi:hypothetical protein